VKKPTGDVLARRVIAGSATPEETKRMATLYLDMAESYKIEMCLPQDFELRAKYKELQAKLKKARKKLRKLKQ